MCSLCNNCSQHVNQVMGGINHSHQMSRSYHLNQMQVKKWYKKTLWILIKIHLFSELQSFITKIEEKLNVINFCKKFLNKLLKRTVSSNNQSSVRKRGI